MNIINIGIAVALSLVVIIVIASTSNKVSKEIMLIGDCVHDINGHNGQMNYREAWTLYSEQCAEEVKNGR